MSYRDFLSRPPTEGADAADGLAPPWLSRPLGKAFLGGLGDGLDDVAGRAKEAVKARMAQLSPADALPVMGTERSIERGPGETEASYRSRLAAARDLWKYGGTPLGLLRAFFVAGYTGAQIRTTAGNLYYLNGAQNLLSGYIGYQPWLGGVGRHWSDIAVYITGAGPAWWGGTPPADNTPEVNFLRKLVATWKPAHCRCVDFGAGINGTLWGNGGAMWGTGTWGGFTGTKVQWTPPNG